MKEVKLGIKNLTVVLLFCLSCGELFASIVNLSQINWNNYFGSPSNQSVDNEVNSDDFEYGKGDSFYYYERSKEYLKRKKYLNAIEELYKSIEYSLNDDDKAFIYNFRASIYDLLIKENRVYRISAINDLQKAFDLSHDLSYLIKVSKIYYRNGNIKRALQEIFRIKKICVKKAEEKLLKQMNVGGKLICLNDEKYILARKFPVYLRATAFEAFIYSESTNKVDQSISLYENALNFTTEIKKSFNDFQCRKYLSAKDDNILNNLAMLYLQKGGAKNIKRAFILAEYINRINHFNLAFSDTYLLASLAKGDLEKASKMNVDILIKLKQKMKFLKGFESIYKLLSARGGYYISFKQCEKLFQLSRDQNVNSKDLVNSLVKEPNFQIAKIISQEIKTLFLSNTVNEINFINFSSYLKNKYGFYVSPSVIQQIINIPSIYSFRNGYTTVSDFALKISSRYFFDKVFNEDISVIINAFVFISRNYDRDFFNFFSRKFMIDNKITFAHFIKTYDYHNENMIFDDLRKSKIFATIKQNILNDDFSSVMDQIPDSNLLKIGKNKTKNTRILK